MKALRASRGLHNVNTSELVGDVGSRSSPGPRRQGRPPREDLPGLRDKIISATRDLLRTRPPTSISRTDIARAANVDPGLIRYYFGNKDRLMSAVVLTFMDEFEHSSFELPASGDIQDLLRHILQFHVGMIQRFPFMHDLLLQEIGQLGNPNGARIRNSLIEAQSIRTEQAIRATNSIELNADELKFLRMMIISIAAFPIRERAVFEQIFDRGHADEGLTQGYCSFAAKIFAQGMRAPSKDGRKPIRSKPKA